MKSFFILKTLLSSQRPPEADRALAEKRGSRFIPASAEGGLPQAVSGKVGIHRWRGSGFQLSLAMTLRVAELRGISTANDNNDVSHHPRSC